jgi:hypothetical protein
MSERINFTTDYPLRITHNEFAHVAQLAEHILGKDEVTGSIPVMGSERRIRRQTWQRLNMRG